MKKSMLTPAIIVISMLLFPANANAFWLDIVKEFVSDGIKMMVIPKSAKSLNASTENKKIAKSNGQYSAEEVYSAITKLSEICANKFVKHIPCAVGEGENFSIGDAREEATAKARVALAKNMGTYVSANAKLESSKSKNNQGVLTVANSYISNAELTTEQFVSGAQEYLSYTYIDEKLSEINGQKVYVTNVVLVMDSELFGKALEYEAKDKPLSEQLIDESKKGIVAIAQNWINKITKK